MQRENTAHKEGREEEVKLLAGRICSLAGLFLSAIGFAVAVLGSDVDLSAGALGLALGILGYFLGARRLGAATVLLGIVAVFFMAAVSTGLIPGLATPGHGYN